jgi:hypothetical protein
MSDLGRVELGRMNSISLSRLPKKPAASRADFEQAVAPAVATNQTQGKSGFELLAERFVCVDHLSRRNLRRIVIVQVDYVPWVRPRAVLEPGHTHPLH